MYRRVVETDVAGRKRRFCGRFSFFSLLRNTHTHTPSQTERGWKTRKREGFFGKQVFKCNGGWGVRENDMIWGVFFFGNETNRKKRRCIELCHIGEGRQKMGSRGHTYLQIPSFSRG